MRKKSRGEIMLLLLLLLAVIAIRIVQPADAEAPAPPPAQTATTAAPTLPMEEQYEIRELVKQTRKLRETDELATPAPSPTPSETPEVAADSAEPDADVMPPLLDSVSLDSQTQWAIYDLCEQDDGLFCAVMAISKKESRFTPAIIGDNGRCVGMMQINYVFHIDRMKALGVTNLLDPIENAAVAISYIKELEKEFFVGPDSHVLYVAYNMGPTGARELFDKGVYSTSYSWDVAAYYEAYMREISTGV